MFTELKIKRNLKRMNEYPEFKERYLHNLKIELALVDEIAENKKLFYRLMHNLNNPNKEKSQKETLNKFYETLLPIKRLKAEYLTERENLEKFAKEHKFYYTWVYEKENFNNY